MAIELAPHDLTGNSSHSPFVVSASSHFSGLDEWKAFDGSAGSGSYWIGTGGGVDYLQIDLGVARLLGSYELQMNSLGESARAPKNWTMKGSNDASSWTVIDTRTNETGWGAGERRVYTIASPSTEYRYYRLDITANNGDATYTQVAEAWFYLGYLSGEFAPHNMTTDSAPSPLVASASSFNTGSNPYKCFNNDVGGWLGTGGGVDWLKIDLGAGNSYVPTQYQIRSAQTAARAPKDWTLEGSNNGSSWTSLDTRTNETGWGAFDLRAYTVTGASNYRYFRLNITANNGDGTYTEVDELLMQGTPGAAVCIGALASRASSIAGNTIFGGAIMRKNVSGQHLYFGLVNATTGAPLTGASVTGTRNIDGGGSGAVTGTITEPASDGQYQLALSTADTNGNCIGFFFTATSAVPVSIIVFTTAADPSDAVRLGLTALPAEPMKVKKNAALSYFAFRMISSADHVTPATGLTVTATRSIDGAAFGACANSVSEIANGWYKINLAAADLNGAVIILRFTATGADDSAGPVVVTQA